MIVNVRQLGEKRHTHQWADEERYTVRGRTPNQEWMKVRQQVCTLCGKTSQK